MTFEAFSFESQVWDELCLVRSRAYANRTLGDASGTGTATEVESPATRNGLAVESPAHEVGCVGFSRRIPGEYSALTEE